MRFLCALEEGTGIWVPPLSLSCPHHRALWPCSTNQTTCPPAPRGALYSIPCTDTRVTDQHVYPAGTHLSQQKQGSRAEAVSESLNIRFINLTRALGTSLCVTFPPSQSSSPRWTCEIFCALEGCTFHLIHEHIEGCSTSVNIMLQTKESLRLESGRSAGSFVHGVLLRRTLWTGLIFPSVLHLIVK